jgi:opacity protein-like surface antigen
MFQRTSSCLLLLTLLTSVSVARAEAWELKGGLGPVFGTEFDPDKKQGLGAQAYLDLGLNDFVSLSMGAGYVEHFFGPGLAYSVANAGIGINTNLDVILFGVGLAWVPFASLRLGFLQTDLDGQPTQQGFGMAIAIGMDYVYSENGSVGLAFEYQGMLSDMDGFPGYLGLTARVGFRWLD